MKHELNFQYFLFKYGLKYLPQDIMTGTARKEKKRKMKELVELPKKYQDKKGTKSNEGTIARLWER